MDRANVVNFGAGPSALPLPVLEEATKGLINYKGTGIGLAELSHRSKEFAALTIDLEQRVRRLLGVPEDKYAVLFTQGGGSGQFSAVVLNLFARHRLVAPDAEERVADYVVTGTWSKKAAEEARRLTIGAGAGSVNVVVDGRKHSADGKSFDGVPSHEHWKPSKKPAYVHYCENETVDGVQFAHEPDSPHAFPFHLFDPDTPIVADYSSSFLSRPIPRLESHALIYAGAQKNVGPAGLTIIIARKDLLVDVDAAAKLGAVPVPYTLAYKTLADSGSLYNTPPMFPMYVAGLVLARIEAEGGLVALEGRNRRKEEKVYEVVKEGENVGKFKLKVKEGGRSWMNVTFEVVGEGAEKRFLDGAEQRGLRQLKGHRSVGGIRVSLYNAVTEEQTNSLVAYIRLFLEQQT